MEEYVTRSEFEQFKKQIEQMTEPMRAINVNVASQDVINRLDELKQDQTQELKTVSDTWLETLQDHYTEHKKGISDVKTVLSGHSKFFEEHGKRLAATATKEDLAALKAAQDARFDKLEATQEQILKLIQKNAGE